jgi:hypothetical protein
MMDDQAGTAKQPIHVIDISSRSDDEDDGVKKPLLQS